MAKIIDKIQVEEPESKQEYPSNATEAELASETENVNEAVYRYYCPACSGTAFTCSSKEYFEGECRSCHASLERDENNYIQL